MSLATRCTACGTVFRVVQDQLKVSEGWVRCGRCNEVFSALEGLFDLDRDASSDVRDAAASGPDANPGAVAPHEQGEFMAAPATNNGAPAALPRTDSGETTETPEEAGGPALQRIAVGAGAGAAIASPELGATESAMTPATPADELTADPAPEADADAAPEFVREAQAQARWHRPWIRAVLATAALVLALALVAQLAHHFRDALVARYPAASTALGDWCGIVECVIAPPRSIQDVLVDSTSLTRASTSDAFTLSLALRNRSSIPLAMPSVELTLTDASGQLVAKRVLRPADFRASSNLLAPGVETPLQVTLGVGSAGVTGYTIEIFNP